MASSDDEDGLPRLAAGPSLPENDCIYDIDPRLAAQHGLATNENCGLYNNGVAHTAATKLLVCTRIKRITNGDDIGTVNVTQVSRETKTSRAFVRKVRNEMLENNGNIINPSQVLPNRVRGPGTKTFDELDMYVLLMLYFEEPSRSNSSYVERLYATTGTITFPSTVSRWFNHYFPISGGFRKPNLVPIDKFKEANFWRAEEYLEAIASIAPRKLRFGDEKLIKGSEVYCRRTRRNVIIGKYFITLGRYIFCCVILNIAIFKLR
jgi:hypothetical protein